MKGNIIHIISSKSYGFIEASNGLRVFLHKDDFRDDWTLMTDLLKSNPIRVTFDLVDLGKGPRAENCRFLDSKIVKITEDNFGNQSER